MEKQPEEMLDDAMDHVTICAVCGDRIPAGEDHECSYVYTPHREDAKDENEEDQKAIVFPGGCDPHGDIRMLRMDMSGNVFSVLCKEDKDQLNKIESRLDRIEFKLHLILSHDSTGHRVNDRGIVVAEDI